MTDTTAPRTAAPDLAEIRERHVEGPMAPYLGRPRAGTQCAIDQQRWPCDAIRLAEAIEPLLALVRAAMELVDDVDPNDTNDPVNWPLVVVLNDALAALPASVRVAARKAE